LKIARNLADDNLFGGLRVKNEALRPVAMVTLPGALAAGQGVLVFIILQGLAGVLTANKFRRWVLGWLNT